MVKVVVGPVSVGVPEGAPAPQAIVESSKQVRMGTLYAMVDAEAEMPTWFAACCLALFALTTIAEAEDLPQNPNEPALQVQSANNLPPQSPTPVTANPIDPAQLPDSLKPWVDWVMSKHPELACPVVDNGRGCLWPGVLTFDARSDGATMSLAVQADRAMPLPLPGGKGSWPQEVRVDGASAPVLDVGGVPVVGLQAGRHTISASYIWNGRPASLPLPAQIGRVALTVDGTPNPWPRIDTDGLRLGAAQVDQRQDQRLDLEVARRVRDGVPLVVETVLTLRASGSGREVDLGDVQVVGTTPVSLTANLPARFTPQGRLVVQVRPGTYEVRFEAVHAGAVAELKRPAATDPWPAVEYWAVATAERVRAVNLGGPPGVDPARTTVPQAWRTLPVFSVSVDTALTFEELRRGEPDPAPNQLNLSREMWVDMDGGGLTVRDTFTGSMHQGWRLDVVGPANLGHASSGGADQVITRTPEGVAGVELRSQSAKIVAESRFDGRPGTMAAVGWNTDVQSLSATLHLPPGWTLLAGTGVDNLDGSVLDQWTLFDLFFVLILAMASARLLGRSWGGLALVALVLARHEAGAPQWTWAALLVLVALASVVPAGWAKNSVQALRAGTLLVLAALLLPFAIGQVQTGLFPSLEQQWAQGGGDLNADQDILTKGAVGGLSAARHSRPKPAPASKQRSVTKNYLSAQTDPSAVVQTGPGVPNWSWNQQALRWSGPVTEDHQMRLFLIGPMGNLLLALLRVLLLGALAMRLADFNTLKGWAKTLAGTVGAIAALLLAGATTPAEAANPDQALRQELEARLTQPPNCAPHCATVPTAYMVVRDDTLQFDAEVHAAADTSWPIPGPTGTWVPDRVTLDGKSATAMMRRTDGFLHLRVPAGVHRVRVEGPLPPTDAVALAFGLVPQRMDWEGEGWALDGRHADGTVDASVQLARMLGESTTAQSAENLSPWLEVHRDLDLGIPWRVRTTVRRVGPTDYPVAIKMPLLVGEAVTDGGFAVADGLVAITLERDQAEATWLSTLEETEAVHLTAPTNVPWTEVWTLSCSPVFACEHSGPAPLQHVVGGAWNPSWRVWPGEAVTVSVRRPHAVEGQTTTIDGATLTLSPGRRQLIGELALNLRSSQGGRQKLTLPEGASLQVVKIDGQPRPLQLRDGTQLHLPIQPGSQQVYISWQQPRPPSIVDTAPKVDLGGPAVNLTVVIKPAEQRWIAMLQGPRWGPVPLFWTYVLIMGLIAWFLSKSEWSSLRFHQWLLLGLGMTQVPVGVPVVVAAWFLALEWRSRHVPSNAILFNLVQLGLVLWTLLSLLGLYSAIHAGLLWQPDMQVAGGGSHDTHLVWFVDHATSSFPQPTVISLPMWAWRVAMLIWSLWLAASLKAWLPWAWRAFSHDGWYRPGLPAKKATASPETLAQPPADQASDGADTEITGPPVA
jgi:hypothetical protein